MTKNIFPLTMSHVIIKIPKMIFDKSMKRIFCAKIHKLFCKKIVRTNKKRKKLFKTAEWLNKYVLDYQMGTPQ